MRGGAKTQSFNAENLITLKSRHPGEYEEFVKIKQERETLVKRSYQQLLVSLLTEVKSKTITTLRAECRMSVFSTASEAFVDCIIISTGRDLLL